MVVCHVEDIVYEYFRLKGYIVSRNIWYRIPKGTKKANGKNRKVLGWSDIDVLAMNEKEVKIIQCVTDAESVSPTQEKFINKIVYGFKTAREYYIKKNKIFERYHPANIKNVFVGETISRKIRSKLEEKNIEVHDLDEILKELLEMLKNTKGLKEEHPLTRTLAFLVRKSSLKLKSV